LDGTLVYVPARSLFGERTLVSVDRSGAARPLTDARRPYEDMALSPDGRRLALTIEGPTWNVWVLDLERGTLSRFTPEHDNRDPAWTRDSKRVVWTSFRAGRFGLHWKPADGSGPEEQLTSSENQHFAGPWSPDGRTMLFQEVAPGGTGTNFFVLPLEGDRKPRPLRQAKSTEEFLALSPDGNWLAYTSSETGREEIYVQAYPGPGARVQVSTAGGRMPVWAANGRELYFRNGDKLMVASIETKPVFKAGVPRVLFEGRFWQAGHDYDVSPDGQRFYFIQEGLAPAQINVIQSWSEELKRRVPAGG
jgi:serine/threonine-protein kinase